MSEVQKLKMQATKEKAKESPGKKQRTNTNTEDKSDTTDNKPSLLFQKSTLPSMLPRMFL